MRQLSFFIAILLAVAIVQAQTKTFRVRAAGFSMGKNMQAPGNQKGENVAFALDERADMPYTQSCVRQTTEQVMQAPKAEVPYFTVRYALPVPPSYTTTETAALTGIDAGVYHHNHSPGFEVLDNGDALAIYFSSPRGKTENDTATTFVQARLRYGSEEWDMPEVFWSTQGGNDQSALLWRDQQRLWFFGGGRDLSDYVPFRIATSDDQGATWTMSIPLFDKRPTDFTAQPITNAFRDPKGNIYMAMDAKDSQSFLWRSSDEGKTWHDMGGRTTGRHSTIVPLDDKGTLLSIGGKNANVDGWTTQNLSHNWGKTWEKATAAPFPQLGSGQRPSMIRLQSGALILVSDGYLHKHAISAPDSWQKPYDAFVAISRDNGQTWHYKTLPAGLPQDKRQPYTSLGYTTIRQSPNGIIHVLSTKSVPGLHYEFNEAWIDSDAADITPENAGGEIRPYKEYYADGRVKSEWSARICPNGRYLLHGQLTDYYPDGRLQHSAFYQNGRKTGREVYLNPDGKKRWTWERSLVTNHGVWTLYRSDGTKKLESRWLTCPQARDAARRYYGYVADGATIHFDEKGKPQKTFLFRDGVLAAEP
ncbi:MAG: exo-alpha-sialidase [Prevotella sp.]|nr:exo-alpha-sialidase [Prevotella sp.]